MKNRSLPFRFFMSLSIWFLSIFVMSVLIFLFIRLFAFYWIGGDFLFSLTDISKALKISVYCSLLCNIVTWFLHWRSKRGE